MSQSRQEKPSGLWTSPLQAADLAAELRFSDVLWDSHEKTLVWREERSDQGVLVCQTPQDSSPRDLTGALSVRAKVGYGAAISPFPMDLFILWQGDDSISSSSPAVRPNRSHPKGESVPLQAFLPMAKS